MAGCSKRARVRASKMKRLRAGFVFVDQLVGQCQHRTVLLAMHELARQVFLDRHRPMQVVVGGEVGDAEGALAEHPVDGVPMQLRTVTEGIEIERRTYGHAGTLYGGRRFRIPLKGSQGKQGLAATLGRCRA